ncbi:MAG: 4-hydroxythreonine-4-phosphate dehydrogenase PdxA [Nitrospirota bacterium]
MKKAIVGITMGDAAGIGPEVIIKALNIPSIYEECCPIVIGDAKILEGFKVQGSRLKVNSVREVEEAKGEFGTIDCIDLANIDLAQLKIGQVNELAGKSAIEYIKKAVNLAQNNKIQAITTAPISKEAINKAGFHFAGHTDFLAYLTHIRQYAMMFVSSPLKVVLVSIHIPLYKAVRGLSKKKVFTTIKLTNHALKDYFGIEKPKIGVAGLNPHAGEAGLFGREEEKEIAPAIEVAQRKGIDAVGPYPPDTIFCRAVKGEFDVVVAMYHDQGLIPLKLLAFDEAVNVTVGLPIIRTSPDHGTAFDIAGKNQANPQSMIEAIKLAIEMVKGRNSIRTP